MVSETHKYECSSVVLSSGKLSPCNDEYFAPNFPDCPPSPNTERQMLKREKELLKNLPSAYRSVPNVALTVNVPREKSSLNNSSKIPNYGSLQSPETRHITNKKKPSGKILRQFSSRGLLSESSSTPKVASSLPARIGSPLMRMPSRFSLTNNSLSSKWENVLKMWLPNSPIPDKAHSLIRKAPIPSEIRGKVWERLIGDPHVITAQLFESCLKRSQAALDAESTLSVILNDAHEDDQFTTAPVSPIRNLQTDFQASSNEKIEIEKQHSGSLRYPSQTSLNETQTALYEQALYSIGTLASGHSIDVEEALPAIAEQSSRPSDCTTEQDLIGRRASETSVDSSTVVQMSMEDVCRPNKEITNQENNQNGLMVSTTFAPPVLDTCDGSSIRELHNEIAESGDANHLCTSTPVAETMSINTSTWTANENWCTNTVVANMWAARSPAASLSATHYYDFLHTTFKDMSGGHATRNLPAWSKVIEVDAARTFQQFPIFRPGTELYQQMRRVLHAFSAYRSELGYIQGANYFVAMLLMQLDDSDPFTRASITSTNSVGRNKFHRDLNANLGNETRCSPMEHKNRLKVDIQLFLV